jgi:ribonuclease III
MNYNTSVDRYLQQFSQTLGYQFKDIDILIRAFTHRSVSIEHNETMEFLGDSLLNCIVAILLYTKYPNLAEGSLSTARASLVSKDSLAIMADALNIPKYIKLININIRLTTAIVADCLEAIIAAIFLDGGFSLTLECVSNLFANQLIAATLIKKDAKTMLQELLQAQYQVSPDYNLIAVNGPDHATIFTMECKALSYRTIGRSISKKAASQIAARAMLDLMEYQ